MAYNSAYTGSQVDAAVGAVRQKETKWDNKQDELTGTEYQLVGFNSAGEAVAVAKPTAADVGAMPAVTGGTAGQVLTKTEAGQEWQNAPDGLPEGGTEGQVLTKTPTGARWDDVPSDIPAGGTQGQVLTKGDGENVTWSDPASGLPTGGTPGQMLYQGEGGPEWGDKPVIYIAITGSYDDGFTADKTAKEILNLVNNGFFVVAKCMENGESPPFYAPLVNVFTAGTSGEETYISLGFCANVEGSVLTASYTYSAEFESVYFSLDTLPASAVSFTPGTTGLTSDNVQDAIEEVQGHIPTDYVPTSRTVNGKALSQNITLDAEDVGAMPPPTRLTHTLSASGWNRNRQTITVNGVITDTSAQDIDISCADKASADAWAAGGVWCSNPTLANRLTFTCTTPPTANINLNIRLWEVG